MGQITNEIAKGQLLAFTFVQDAVAASQTNVQLNIQEVNAGATLAIDEVPMPFAGSVVGLAYTLSAAGTAGALSVGATINGTESATTTQAVGTNVRGTKKFLREAVRFAAGDRIGVEITSDGSWDGTSSDLAVTVYVLVDLEGI